MTAMEALASNGLDPEALRLFRMRQSDECVYELYPSCSQEPANLMPRPQNRMGMGMGLFGNMFGGMFG